MGGEVSCKSAVGKGTEFKIKLSAPCIPQYIEEDANQFLIMSKLNSNRFVNYYNDKK